MDVTFQPYKRAKKKNDSKYKIFRIVQFMSARWATGQATVKVILPQITFSCTNI